MNKRSIVALQVLHGASHARETLAKPQVIGWIRLRWLPNSPIPVATVLQVNNADVMVPHRGTSRLKPKIMDATEALLEDLGRHDR